MSEQLIAMQQNLGLGHKGEIIITTQERVDNNRPMIAKDIINAEHAEWLTLCWNSHDDLLAACEAFVEAHEKSHQLEKTDIALRLAIAAIAAANKE